MKLGERLRRFFFPPAGSPRWMFIPPLLILLVLGIGLIGGGTYAWDYSNSPRFCGTTCHTMPPQNTAYLASPHANVYCTECHLGRGFFGQTFARKSEDVREIVSMTFHLYEYPIRASRTRPALETCEKCHQPEAFANDSLVGITHYASDTDNTLTTTYLILKTGGGAKQQGLGKGIHWHIVNQVQYYATDALSQNIPFVRVTNDDGTTTDYVDVQSGFDPKTMDTSKLKTMDCVTCHNRVTHNFMPPTQSVDLAMSRGLIDPGIPDIHLKAVELLTAKYTSRDDAMQAIAGLDKYYQNSTYTGHEDKITAAIKAIQNIYDQTVFQDQKIDWTTYPNNLGHINSPGCFRCHDGKHLNSSQQAIRLECNLCHSIPVVSGSQDFVSRIEISRGPEPTTHLNPNWISLHNHSIDTSCSACHTTEDPGGTSNKSFCSNSACHGNVYTFAGFDAPKLRDILQAQLPTPAPTPTPGAPVGNPTWDTVIGSLFSTKCGMCHNATALAGGMDLTTYATAMKGGKDGVVIVAGDSANSLLIKTQSDKHFVNLSADELALVKSWIDAGAPEK
ncbi:MAG TPA: NapC/NirT family cytochrome c [Anaerolineales bacterium]